MQTHQKKNQKVDFMAKSATTHFICIALLSDGQIWR